MYIKKRKSWKGFAGFPQKSAMASYVYLVENWEDEKETKFDKFLEGNKLGGPTAMAPTVSTLLEYVYCLFVCLFVYLCTSMWFHIHCNMLFICYM